MLKHLQHDQHALKKLIEGSHRSKFYVKYSESAVVLEEPVFYIQTVFSVWP